MGRKKRLRVPLLASIICQVCGKICKRKVPPDASPGYFDCDGCANRTNTPPSACCVICAFTKKKCVPSLRLEAHRLGLELR
ncbi:hypothetical protein FJZ22_02450 [Candidatus Pacearchaeota archaeon]|nr:hypothetical protein [Candidatus Pacearchaeota archaeon]